MCDDAEQRFWSSCTGRGRKKGAAEGGDAGEYYSGNEACRAAYGAAHKSAYRGPHGAAHKSSHRTCDESAYGADDSCAGDDAAF